MLSRRDVCLSPRMAMVQRRWAYRPAYTSTQVPSVQPESRRDRFISGSFLAVVAARPDMPCCGVRPGSTVPRMDGVWILGGYQSDFARNLTREGRDFAALTAEVVDGTLAAAG